MATAKTANRLDAKARTVPSDRELIYLEPAALTEPHDDRTVIASPGR